MTARGSSLRICWDRARGCCEAGPLPSMPRCRVSIHENLERILWLRKRRRRRRPRRRRPRSRRRSEFSPGWSAQLRPGSQPPGYVLEKWRAEGSAFLFRNECVARMSVAKSGNDVGSVPDVAALILATKILTAPRARAWRRAPQNRRQSCGGARPSPSAA